MFYFDVILNDNIASDRQQMWVVIYSHGHIGNHDFNSCWFRRWLKGSTSLPIYEQVNVFYCTISK